MSSGSVVWLTGLPGAGKTTIAELLHEELEWSGRRACILDGDELRTGLCADLGFSPADRLENLRRVVEVARLLVGRGVVVIVALVSPYRSHRSLAREQFPGRFIEAWVDCPVDVCRARDPKGMYRRADRGELANFTGVSAPYEPPARADVHLRTDAMPVDRCVAALMGPLQSSLAEEAA